jgi:5-methylcytosine-specific restriction endonuclease McrA
MAMPKEKTWRHLCKIEALTEQKGRCKYCKAPLTAANATADHVRPVSRRGRTTRENIVAACRHCNQTKGDMHDARFTSLIYRSRAKGNNPDILLIWAARKIWIKTHKACARIERAVR